MMETDKDAIIKELREALEALIDASCFGKYTAAKQLLIVAAQSKALAVLEKTKP